MLYLNNLIKSGGGTGPVKPGNLTINVKVLIPADFPRDEESFIDFKRFGKKRFFICKITKKEVV